MKRAMVNLSEKLIHLKIVGFWRNAHLPLVLIDQSIGAALTGTKLKYMMVHPRI